MKQLIYSFFWIVWIGVSACTPQMQPPEYYFQNKRVLFLGNSITQNGAYVSFIEYFLHQQHPEWKTDIISIGLSSETVSCLTEKDHPFPRPCLSERLNRALEIVKPDVVVAGYGMNDGIYHPLDEQRKKAYQEGILHLMNEVRQAGASLILLTPPPFDPHPVKDRLVGIDAPDFSYKNPYEGYNEVLADYARWLRSLATPRIRVIDLHTAMGDELERWRKKNPGAGFSQDGIHPSDEGHLFMATCFLEGMGLKVPNLKLSNWSAITEDALFRRIDAQRRIRSQSMLAYVGYIRGDTVASVSAKPLLILMGGQSNMVGLGKKDDLSERSLPGQFTYIHFGIPGGVAEEEKSFGPERGLCRLLEEKFPQQPIILVKYAVGGSSLLDWAPDYSPEKAMITGNPEFGNLFEFFFQQIDSIVQLYDPDITALLWMQGERDARIAEAGKDYERNLRRFITAFRDRIGREELPFCMGVINPPADQYPAVEQVRKAQQQVAADLPQVYVIETDDLTKWEDRLHYDSQGQLLLGERFGRALADIIASQLTD